MNNQIVSIDNLNAYISKNEVVYQPCGELIEVSNENNQENFKNLQNYFDHASGFVAYRKGDRFIREAFEDIDNWSKADDVLILFETMGVVICVPRNLALENKIIGA